MVLMSGICRYVNVAIGVELLLCDFEMAGRVGHVFISPRASHRAVVCIGECVRV